MRFVTHISGVITNTGKAIDINVDGRNVVIIGGNGSGKTSLLKLIEAQLTNNILIGEHNNLTTLQLAILETQSAIEKNQDPLQLGNLNFIVQENISRLQNIIRPLKIEYNNAQDFIELAKNKKASVCFFEAGRKANISSSGATSASKPQIENLSFNTNLSTQIEQHLVNLRVRIALGVANESDVRLIEIEKWFEDFIKSLKYLFENDSTDLHFDPDKLRYFITQNHGKIFSFQDLSSGYLAILDIYADLLMRCAYLETVPSEMEGVILIDEIDVHLHVSLQRKIFPFLKNSFPKLQFIVTTHSPFVVTSVDDALIYDVSTNTESTDLSMYSLEAVVEGLLGIRAISKALEDSINELTTITDEGSINIKRAEEILIKIAPSFEALDVESKVFYQIAKNKVLKQKIKEDQ